MPCVFLKKDQGSHKSKLKLFNTTDQQDQIQEQQQEK